MPENIIDKLSSANSPEIYLELQVLKSARAGYDNDGEKQKHSAKIRAVVCYKGNGEFVLKAPYSFNITA